MLLTQEELRERLIALHQASLKLVQETSLDRLLERITAIAREQVGARYAALGVLDEEGKLRRFVTVGMSEEQIKQIPHWPRGEGLIGVLMSGGEIVRLAEISADPRHAGFPPGHPIMHSFLGVPICHSGRQLGQIYLTDKQGAAEFSLEDEMIIEMLANYAAVAIQNAHLYETLRKREEDFTHRNQDLALLNEVGATLASSLDLDEILNKTLTLLMKYFNMEAGEIYLYEEEGETLRLALHRGEAAEAFWSRTRFRLGEGIVGLAAQTLQSVVSDDLAREAHFAREALVQAGFRQIACVPLTTSGRLKGVLTMTTRQTRPLDEGEIRLLESVAGWASMAIENAQLHYNARRLAVLEERERIGMDLHDGVVQAIYGVGLSLEDIRLSLSKDPSGAEARLQKVIADLDLVIRNIRNYILDLRPYQLRGESLAQGLQRLVTEFRQNTSAEVVFKAPKDLLSELPSSHALALFHICQEALANVAKHAHARHVSVELWTTSDRVLLEIQDDGQGFDMETANHTVGHGLANMSTRALQVGGEVEVSSAPGSGTTVLAWVPRCSPR